MKIKLVADEKYLPKYANPTDARLDLKAKIQNTEPFVVKEYNGQEYSDTETSTWILPNETVKVDSGVQAAVPVGYELNMVVRSSTGIKKNLELANGTGIIDAGYRDKIIMALRNFGKEPVQINDGDRLCQFAIIKVEPVEIEVVQDDDDFRNGDRGGGIGSTGT